MTLPTLPVPEAPRKYGTVTYNAPTVNLSRTYYADSCEGGRWQADPADSENDVKTTGSVGTVTVVIKEHELCGHHADRQCQLRPTSLSPLLRHLYGKRPDLQWYRTGAGYSGPRPLAAQCSTGSDSKWVSSSPQRKMPGNTPFGFKVQEMQSTQMWQNKACL